MATPAAAKTTTNSDRQLMSTSGPPVQDQFPRPKAQPVAHGDQNLARFESWKATTQKPGVNTVILTKCVWNCDVVHGLDNMKK